jgi:hypothetical protein
MEAKTETTRQRREARAAAGAAELERRLADTLESGLAEAAADPRTLSDPAARMVDAQAPGLAARLRESSELPGGRGSGSDWPSRLLEEYALLHLLAAGYGRLGALPAPLAATVRTRVGIPTAVAEVLAAGPRVRDRWLVLGRRESSEADRLTARRTWLLGLRTGRTALLLAYAGPGRPPAGPLLPVGGGLDAEVAYYPAAHPLRAVLSDTTAGDGPDAVPAEGIPPGRSLDEALADYSAALAADPWTDRIPVVLRDVSCRPGPESWLIVEPGTGRAVPVDGRYAADAGLWRLTAVGGGHPLTVFGELGHRGFAPLTCWAGGARAAVQVHR